MVEKYYLPLILDLSHLFKVVGLCDISINAVHKCAALFPATTPVHRSINPNDFVRDPIYQAVIICRPEMLHTSNAVDALKEGKHVFITEPAAFSAHLASKLVDAAMSSMGVCFIGSPRIYSGLLGAARNIMSDPRLLQHVRAYDVMYQDAILKSRGFGIFEECADLTIKVKDNVKRESQSILNHALTNDCGIKIPRNQAKLMTDQKRAFAVLLTYGIHGLSTIRDLFGMPKNIASAYWHSQQPLWTIVLQYDYFAVTYECGIHRFPIFDSFLEMFYTNKVIRLDFNFPYRKTRPAAMHVKQMLGETQPSESVEKVRNDDQNMTMFIEFWNTVNDVTAVLKTSAVGAMSDYELCAMIMRKAFGGEPENTS